VRREEEKSARTEGLAALRVNANTAKQPTALRRVWSNFIAEGQEQVAQQKAA
jgi:hypothetical protein